MAAPATPSSEWRFYLSQDVDLQVRVRIGSVFGVLPHARCSHDDVGGPRPSAACVEACLVAGGEVLGLEARTTYAEVASEGAVWSEWLTFCIKYRDLPADAYLCLSLSELAPGSPPLHVGCTTLPLFSKKGRLKTGQQRLQVWEGEALDTTQPQLLLGKPPLEQRSQGSQLEHLAKLHSRGELPRCEWLDALSFREVQRMRAAELRAAVADGVLLLTLELPVFTHPVLYHQQPSAPVAAALVVPPGTAGGTASAATSAAVPAGATSAPSTVATGSGGGTSGAAPDVLWQVYDPEVGLDNPAELKAAKLARSVTRGVVDRQLKPNGEQRRAIAAVLRLPPNKPLSADAKALLWRFRYSLVTEKRALTKFLKCVDWSDAQEAQQAVELMGSWAPIEVADALELLSSDFKADPVRTHAVVALAAKEDAELLHYLLQLVQALRYEATDGSRLSGFLVARAAASPALAINLHWYLFAEWEDADFGGRASAVHGALVAALAGSGRAGEAVWAAIRRQTELMSQLAYISRELKMARLKAARATERLREMVAAHGPCSELTTMRVPLPLNPGLMLEGLLPQECSCFRSAQLPLRLVFRTAPHPVDWQQGVTQLTGSSSIGSSSTAAAALQSCAPDAAADGGGADDNNTAAPGAGAAAARCSVTVIYKKGDDLRQDQFVLQMISLMDSLLKRENLDLHLTPYRVLPTGSDDGLVEYVPSAPLSRILAEHRTIHRYLGQTQADPTGPFGLRTAALEAFVRSCAGYCVMTYILGVGDRHLDNLMLAPDGRLFHIDFGYILGSDPKPFPPPMKLCREMIEAMGGQDSTYYAQFRMLSCEAYNILRKSADLILSLFHLMAGASIPAIRQHPENALLKLTEKLRLDLDDEAAIEALQGLINESATALMPQIVETTHRWAQYWR